MKIKTQLCAISMKEYLQKNVQIVIYQFIKLEDVCIWLVRNAIMSSVGCANNQTTTTTTGAVFGESTQK